MNDELVKALIAMQESGWGVGGRLVNESDKIESNYQIGDDKKDDTL